MNIKETEVGQLDKEQVKLLKDLDAEARELDGMGAAFRAKQRAFWEELHKKHTLRFSHHYYIKSGYIYTQELDT